MRASYFPGSGTLLERTFLEGKAEGEAVGKTEGKAEGKVSLLLKLLDARGISLTEDAGARINACTDLDTIDVWFTRALTAGTLAEVLDPAAG